MAMTMTDQPVALSPEALELLKEMAKCRTGIFIGVDATTKLLWDVGAIEWDRLTFPRDRVGRIYGLRLTDIGRAYLVQMEAERGK
jgi:hypothetical protein